MTNKYNDFTKMLAESQVAGYLLTDYLNLVTTCDFPVDPDSYSEGWVKTNLFHAEDEFVEKILTLFSRSLIYVVKENSKNE